jgi:hypothetical protein
MRGARWCLDSGSKVLQVTQFSEAAFSSEALKQRSRAADWMHMEIRKLPGQFDRIRHRVVCELIVGGSSHRAIVTDVSASGLYVRTQEAATPGSPLRLILHEEAGEVELDAEVVREHRLSQHHATGIPSGLGVRIVAAPEAYFRLLVRLSA